MTIARSPRAAPADADHLQGVRHPVTVASSSGTTPADHRRWALHDNVFRVDQLPNHGSLGPARWLRRCPARGQRESCGSGAGAFPEAEAASWKAKCPDTVILTDRA